MDYLKSDDDYIQLIANEQNGSITQTEENAFNIIAVCECFREKGLNANEIIFNICLKYLDEIAYNRLVMEYLTEYYKPSRDGAYKASELSKIWKAYFNDSRYGNRDYYVWNDSAPQRTICEMFDIRPPVALKIAIVMENANEDYTNYITNLKRCGQKRISGNQIKMLNAKNKKYVDYDDAAAVDVIVERIIETPH